MANGGPNANSCGSSADGTRFFVTTYSALVPSDTDNGDSLFHANKDVYEISNGQATLVSTGPAGANGPFDAFCVGKSLDGTRVFFATAEPLVAADTDTQVDVYERSAGQTTLISTGPDGGSGPFDATSFSNPGISDDGDHVVFSTLESLVAADTDSQYDLYERSGGATTLVSTGPTGGNGGSYADFVGASADGSRVYFQTDEPLVAADTDGQWDVYERTGGQTRIATVGPAGGNGAFDVNSPHRRAWKRRPALPHRGEPRRVGHRQPVRHLRVERD